MKQAFGNSGEELWDKMNEVGHIKSSSGEKIFIFINTIFLLLVGFITLYPFIHMLAVSFSDEFNASAGLVKLLPRVKNIFGFSFNAYEKVFTSKDLLISYKNTVIYVTLGTAINLFMTSICAYPLSKARLKGKRIISLYIVFTMYFSGGMIPGYLLIKDLGWINHMWAIIVPPAINVFYMIIMRTNFEAIPDSLEDAASIDGMTNIGILFKIYLPLSKPIIATLALYYAVFHWNSFFTAMIFLNDKNKFPLQLILRNIIIQGQMADMNPTTIANIDDSAAGESIKYATIMFATVPILAIYPFIQKYFIQGMMLGSVKA